MQRASTLASNFPKMLAFQLAAATFPGTSLSSKYPKKASLWEATKLVRGLSSALFLDSISACLDSTYSTYAWTESLTPEDVLGVSKILERPLDREASWKMLSMCPMSRILWAHSSKAPALGVEDISCGVSLSLASCSGERPDTLKPRGTVVVSKSIPLTDSLKHSLTDRTLLSESRAKNFRKDSRSQSTVYSFWPPPTSMLPPYLEHSSHILHPQGVIFLKSFSPVLPSRSSPPPMEALKDSSSNCSAGVSPCRGPESCSLLPMDARSSGLRDNRILSEHFWPSLVRCPW